MRDPARHGRLLLGGAATGLGPSVSVQSPEQPNLASCEDITIDPDIAREAALLTRIGLGTVFALLVLLMTVTTLVHQLSARFLGDAAKTTAPQSAEAEAASHDRALAAAVAVSALLANPGRAQTHVGGGG